MFDKFEDRREAGKLLAEKLGEYSGRDDVLVVGLPRGGVPIAFEVAQALKLPMDILVVRKLGTPGRRELAMGAIGPDDIQVLNDEVIEEHAVTEEDIEHVVRSEKGIMKRRQDAYRGGTDRQSYTDKTVIIVDDGLATGASMRAAIATVRADDPTSIVVAVPTGAPATCDEFREIVDSVVCVEEPVPFFGVAQSYKDFQQVSDDEVRDLLEKSDG